MKIRIKLFHLNIFSILILIASSCSTGNFSSKARYTKLKFINNSENNIKHFTQTAESATAIGDTSIRNTIILNKSAIKPEFDNFVAINNEVSNTYSQNDIELPSIFETLNNTNTELNGQISTNPVNQPENIAEITKKLKNNKQNDSEDWWLIFAGLIPLLFVIYLAIVLD